MNNKFFRKNKPGSALLIVIMILGGVFVASFGVGYMVFLNLKSSDIQSQSFKAYAAAEAGAERFRYEVLKNNFDLTNNCGDNILSETLSDGGSFQVDCSATDLSATVKGRYKNLSRSLNLDIRDVLLIHADSDPMLDSSVWNRTSSVVGAVVSTSTSKFGGYSAYFPGTSTTTGDYIQFDNSDNFNFGGQDFTIDFWLKTSQSAAFSFPISFQTAGVGSAGWYAMTVSNNFVFQSNDGSEFQINSGVAINDNIWHHVAVVRYNNTITIYIDGQNKASRNSVGSLVSYASPMLIGAQYGDLTTYPFVGTLDEIRITKGTARWTSDFVVPISPYGRHLNYK